MKLRQYFWIAVLCTALAVGVFPSYSQQNQPSTGFQVSTLGALNVGVYEGATSFAELKQHGNFGLGTFVGLDGEMVALDGKFYQIKTDGLAYNVSDEMKTPFAAVTFFHSERSLPITGKITYQELQQEINNQLPTQNLPYAIKIQGVFPYLKVRSVPKQIPPYPPLSEVVKIQSVFELRNVKGTIVGFRMPSYFKNINAAGFHFHFITSDRKAGGHVLDGEFLNPWADVAMIRDWQMQLPENDSFKQAALE